MCVRACVRVEGRMTMKRVPILSSHRIARYSNANDWITDIYKYKCTGYAYIINKKVQTYRQSHRQRVGQSTSQTDICLAH